MSPTADLALKGLDHRHFVRTTAKGERSCQKTCDTSRQHRHHKIPQKHGPLPPLPTCYRLLYTAPCTCRSWCSSTARCRFNCAEVFSKAVYLDALELQLSLFVVERPLEPEGAAGKSGLRSMV